MQIYMSDAGNAVTVSKIQDGYVYLDRIGIIDSEGESHDVKQDRWAVVPQFWFQGENTLQPAVRTMGGNFMLESDWIDSLTA